MRPRTKDPVGYRRRRVAMACMFLGAVAVAGPTSARNGVIEISQVCASVGCFLADGPGFPVTVGTSGSYRLTSNLVVGDADTSAILVQADDVSIDLNGFQIRGVAVCTGLGPSLSCTPSGAGHGIASDPGTLPARTEVFGGSITGMGASAVSLVDQAVVRDLRVVGNAGTGILLVDGGHIEDCIVSSNGLHGVSAGADLVVRQAVARGNAGTGILASSGALATESVAVLNGANGVKLGLASHVIASVATHNTGHGIDVGSGGSASINAARANGGFGFWLRQTTRYSLNAVTENLGGTVRLGRPRVMNICQPAGAVATPCP